MGYVFALALSKTAFTSGVSSGEGASVYLNLPLVWSLLSLRLQHRHAEIQSAVLLNAGRLGACSDRWKVIKFSVISTF